MCGRYHLRKAPRKIRANALPPDFSETRINPFLKLDRWNIAPTQQAPILRLIDGEWAGGEMRWGFLPAWMNDRTKYQINARAETVFEKPMFRSAASATRCLVLADGWYEWQKVADGKQPWNFEPAEPFAFAGLWTRGRDSEGEPEDTYLILTVDANDVAGRVHNRMPVVLPPEAWSAWVKDGERDLLRPYGGELNAWPVTRKMGSPRYNQPDAVEAIA